MKKFKFTFDLICSEGDVPIDTTIYAVSKSKARAKARSYTRVYSEACKAQIRNRKISAI